MSVVGRSNRWKFLFFGPAHSCAKTLSAAKPIAECPLAAIVAHRLTGGEISPLT
jgi:hypothetical protein